MATTDAPQKADVNKGDSGQSGTDPWASARALIDAPGGSINIAYEAVDRHVLNGHGEDVALRFLASVGEPLNSEAVLGSERVFGQPCHDNSWQTETGGIMIANCPGTKVKPGSIGKAMPGIEACVTGLPDETAGEIVKAYVTLNTGYTPDNDLERDIRGHARKRLGPAVAPREVIFRNTLPKTRSGKIMRRLLKARELGLPEGDISTLETDET